MEPMTVERADVVAFRLERHQLDREPGSAPATDVDLLDLGVQDTGTFGSAWALEVRGARPARPPTPTTSCWPGRSGARPTPTGAGTSARSPSPPRRSPRPTRPPGSSTRRSSSGEAGSTSLDALRDRGPPHARHRPPAAVEGRRSSRLSERLDPPYLRYCRSCDATHSYEQTFRLAALQAGLELEPGTSPPVLRRIPGRRAAPTGTSGPRRIPASTSSGATCASTGRPREGARRLPRRASRRGQGQRPRRRRRRQGPRRRREGRRRGDRASPWPTTSRCWPAPPSGPATRVVRLVGSHDPYLQLRDRDLLVAERPKQKDLWRTLGRPGAVLVDGEVVGTWRPRTSGGALSVKARPVVADQGPDPGRGARRSRTARGPSRAPAAGGRRCLIPSPRGRWPG